MFLTRIITMLRVVVMLEAALSHLLDNELKAWYFDIINTIEIINDFVNNCQT